MYHTACDQKNFDCYGYDYLYCFYCIASTSANVKLRRSARGMGRERARYWRSAHARISPNLDADDIANLVLGSDAAERLGMKDGAFKQDLRVAAERFTAQDYFAFDTVHEPPPEDVPDECACGSDNKRGRKTCYRCKRRLTMLSSYAVWTDALIRSYTGDRYGIKLGASFADVMKWLPTMRPYPTYVEEYTPDFYWALYAVTHVVYTLNDYSFFRLSPRCLPEEYAFLKQNLRHFIDMEDPESVGELLDTLKSFGLSENHSLISRGMDFLLSRQNPDGSWGDPKASDIYQRYHTTWTAIDGLREYAWPGGKLKPQSVKG